MPSSPLVLSPTHHRWWEVLTPHRWVIPYDSSLHVGPEIDIGEAAGASSGTVVGSPQHTNDPLACCAHAPVLPAATATKSESVVNTACGVKNCVFVPSPSLFVTFPPQQKTRPFVSMPQVKSA